jgi:hypothetical protein
MVIEMGVSPVVEVAAFAAVVEVGDVELVLPQAAARRATPKIPPTAETLRADFD